MRILLFGKGGQVGWELQRALAPLGELVALDSSDPGGDFTRPDSVVEAIRRIRPSIIVNAAAHTAVDAAEREVDLARAINATTPGAIACEAAALGAWLIHYSTDYVFNGAGTRPWVENDQTGPLSAYGQTKLEGEELIRESGARYLIFRTSWVYAARGGNFAKTILRLARERERLTVVDDQVGAPTGAELIADVTAHAVRITTVRQDLAGTYHLVAAGETSWFGYAQHVIAKARSLGEHLMVAEVTPVPTTAYPTPACRPANSRMDTNRLRETFGLTLPSWEHGVDRMLVEHLGK